ncbi:hypothetical protein [Caballeronia sp. INML1]|nr:hypothetical protein [Caballeronia sp. INML1]
MSSSFSVEHFESCVYGEKPDEAIAPLPNSTRCSPKDHSSTC